MNKSLLFLLLILIVFSCKNDNPKSSELKKDFYIVNAIGKTKNGTYTFCGTVPKEVDYEYRTGNWKFITNENIKIAEGEYIVILKEVDNSGGCGYKYFENKVDMKKWKFWNNEGQEIEPTKQLINIIESKQTEHSVYLKENPVANTVYN